MTKAVAVSDKAQDRAAPSRDRHAARTTETVVPEIGVAALHRTYGNRALGRLITTGIIQPSLRIGAPNDEYEQEADRVAEQVMRMPEPGLQRKPG